MTSRADLAKAVSEYGSNVDMQPVTSLSDYGSDISLDYLDEDAPTEPTTEKSALLPSIEFEEGEREDEGQRIDGFVQAQRSALLRVAKGKPDDVQSSPVQEQEALEVEYAHGSRQAWSVTTPTPISPGSRHQNPSQASRPLLPLPPIDAAESDTRSPLERFRTEPRKPLSVTDLVSPAWCELQYLYTLSKFGRKPRTQAMRTGSKIHQKLEDEVHATVPVQVQSKQDRFGLRMWNAISGLRCLRETGLTRELEVWGVIHGQVVNGVIDELSYQCPDPAFEQRMQGCKAEKSGGIPPLQPSQPSVLKTFSRTPNPAQDQFAGIGSLQPTRQVYIADVKTRSVPSIPTGASLRPTWMQLMLYHKLIESLSLNTVDAETVFMRYNLRPLEPFTPVFMKDVDSIGPNNEAYTFPNLLSLWSLLVTELQLTLPPTCLSPLLRAEFRYAKTGGVIGSQLTVYESDVIDSYIEEEMAFWKGDRRPKGVEIEEAFKCKMCDFAEGCSWRKTKIREATEKSRLKQQARERSAV
ncbi:exonuclease V a 5' deoxyribonuclease-domain-containing protein [Pyrenochaeta sp. MPI-SDFR-AT-0127]|nr:exonuclease V a 5' deoxyribonuclease-domain-containing protein [Pyrenochaeta sp. MPI-SDFR-AT-0127]